MGFAGHFGLGHFFWSMDKIISSKQKDEDIKKERRTGTALQNHHSSYHDLFILVYSGLFCVLVSYCVHLLVVDLGLITNLKSATD